MRVDVMVIGAGAAGMAAALKAKEEGAEVLLVERDERTGGILNQCIHNGFGLHYFRQELTGPEYAERFQERMEKMGIKTLVNAYVKQVDDRKVILVTERGIEKVKVGALVYATGARERPFGSLMIPGDRPSGIFTAGVAQRLINIENRLPGKRALILGSGDIGLIMARRLTLEGMEVVGVVERLPYAGGLLRNVIQCLEDYNIPLFLSSTVVEVRGRERLEEVVVAKVDENFKPIPGTEKVFKVDTLVLSVGLIPQVELIENLVVKNPTSRGIGVSNIGQSSKEWIFSAGNCTVIFDLVDYVSYEGEMAGRYAAKFVKGEVPQEKIPVKPGKNVMVVHPIWYTPVEPLTLYLRVKKPMEKGKLTVGRFEKEFEDLVPSEMLKVKIPDRDLEGFDEIVVSVEEVE
ncbi:pyridine nucleotide-disulfide oxidoreductase [Thermotoga sp. RQ7]|uniref:NAD(P)/FAD-dependent oxidoreductase n=1 Tax=Thermotoga sp. RQ7 TaxID=126738 RepID=UPI0005A344DE|nr:FAD-dependent oxidoreductase [Thermotoga sp. RQ7]AJG41151.1 pyridine nucleotide-disulfide oxidoreductase [Thermotoga sp. RQ7]